MPETITQPAICRICSAHCGVIATVTDGRLTKVTGDPDNPMFKGYTCAKDGHCLRSTTTRSAC